MEKKQFSDSFPRAIAFILGEANIKGEWQFYQTVHIPSR